MSDKSIITAIQWVPKGINWVKRIRKKESERIWFDWPGTRRIETRSTCIITFARRNGRR